MELRKDAVQQRRGHESDQGEEDQSRIKNIHPDRETPQFGFRMVGQGLFPENQYRPLHGLAGGFDSGQPEHDHAPRNRRQHNEKRPAEGARFGDERTPGDSTRVVNNARTCPLTADHSDYPDVFFSTPDSVEIEQEETEKTRKLRSFRLPL